MPVTISEKPILFSTEMIQAILDGRKTQTRRVIKPQPEKQHYVKTFLEKGAGSVSTSELTEADHEYGELYDNSPYGLPGDELWVRETFRPVSYSEHGWILKYKADGETQKVERLFPLEDDDKEIHWAETTGQQFEEYHTTPWRPSIHMPRNASRIQLQVKDIQVERVQECTTEAIKAEGVLPNTGPDGKLRWVLGEKHAPVSYLPHGIFSDDNNQELTKEMIYNVYFASLWDRINADRGYPWENNPWVWVVKFEIQSIQNR